MPEGKLEHPLANRFYDWIASKVSTPPEAPSAP